MPYTLEEPFEVYHANTRFAPERLHVTSRKDPWLSVYASEEQFEQLREELPMHTLIPAVWQAYLNLPAELRPTRPAEWAWGFIRARQLSLPKGGVFRPVGSLDADAICHHDDYAVYTARKVGFQQYVFYVQAQYTVHHTLGQAA